MKVYKSMLGVVMRCKVHSLNNLKTRAGQSAAICVEVTPGSFLAYDLKDKYYPVLFEASDFYEFIAWFKRNYQTDYLVKQYIAIWKSYGRKGRK